jgi:hypothetical protein
MLSIIGRLVYNSNENFTNNVKKIHGTALDPRTAPPAHPAAHCARPAAWSRAAQLLNLTQSALSHQVKLLEERYDAAVRTQIHAVAFTPPGLACWRWPMQVLPQVGAAERDVARLASRAPAKLRIAVECHTCFDWLMPVMDAFRSAGPRWSRTSCPAFRPTRSRCCCRTAPTSRSSRRLDGPDLKRWCSTRCSASKSWRCWPRTTACGHAARLDGVRDFEGETLITYPVPRRNARRGAPGAGPAGVKPRAPHHRTDGGDAAAGGERARCGCAAQVGGERATWSAAMCMFFTTASSPPMAARLAMADTTTSTRITPCPSS